MWLRLIMWQMCCFLQMFPVSQDCVAVWLQDDNNLLLYLVNSVQFSSGPSLLSPSFLISSFTSLSLASVRCFLFISISLSSAPRAKPRGPAALSARRIEWKMSLFIYGCSLFASCTALQEISLRLICVSVCVARVAGTLQDENMSKHHHCWDVCRAAEGPSVDKNRFNVSSWTSWQFWHQSGYKYYRQRG